jgi:hypothetical protein
VKITARKCEWFADRKKTLLKPTAPVDGADPDPDEVIEFLTTKKRLTKQYLFD